MRLEPMWRRCCMQKKTCRKTENHIFVNGYFGCSGHVATGHLKRNTFMSSEPEALLGMDNTKARDCDLVS